MFTRLGIHIVWAATTSKPDWPIRIYILELLSLYGHVHTSFYGFQIVPIYFGLVCFRTHSNDDTRAQ
ncbi:unnamed protein product [Candida parapsilosis]